MFEISPSIIRRTSVGRSKKTTSKTGENRSAKELCTGTAGASTAIAGTGALHPAPLVSPRAVGRFQSSERSMLAVTGFGRATGILCCAILNSCRCAAAYVPGCQHLTPSRSWARNLQCGCVPGYALFTAAADGRHEDAASAPLRDINSTVKVQHRSQISLEGLIAMMTP